MTTMHTPGPWLIAYINDIDAIVTDDGTAVMDTRGASAADLSLAANAPLLLAALRELIGEWDETHADEDHRTGYTLDTNGVQMARAAIARATYTGE